MFYKRVMTMPNNQNATMSSGMVHNMTLSSLSSINSNLGMNIAEGDVHTRGMSTCTYLVCHDPDLRSFDQIKNN